MQETIRYCTTADGVRIAFATSGEGYPVVRVLGWLTHLEFERGGPLWQPWVRHLGGRHRLVRYDMRGIGLSDREATDFTLEARIADLSAVVDALALERFALVGSSDGGYTAIAYTAAHPERVSHLVLYGALAHQRLDPASLEQFEGLQMLVRHLWGQNSPALRQLFATLFHPDADSAFYDWFNELQRVSIDPAAAAAYIASLPTIDVRSLLPSICVPTLVIHRRDDQGVPFDLGRELAATIPGATFLPLAGRNHIPQPQEPETAQIFEAIAAFVAGAGAQDGKVAQTTDAAGAKLSPRECEVLQLIAAGCSTHEIAARLVISEGTVERHVTNLYSKIGAVNRADATAFAYRNGLASAE
ncbi:MAG TPA: alpha/beta fold hydrolase [Dehalococcoidia bacterium]|nr:alpha/beta fold hydrolase [Dehalococcoidia bacterium]